MTGPADDPAARLRAVLRLLADHDVDYVLIGGHAARLQGWQGHTVDVDVVLARDDDNLGRLAAALESVHPRTKVEGIPDGYPLPHPVDADYLRRMLSVGFVTDVGEIDVVLTPIGVPEYEQWVAGARTTPVRRGDGARGVPGDHHRRQGGPPAGEGRDHVVEFRALLAARDHDTGWQVDAARDSGQDREPPAWDK